MALQLDEYVAKIQWYKSQSRYRVSRATLSLVVVLARPLPLPRPHPLPHLRSVLLLPASYFCYQNRRHNDSNTAKASMSEARSQAIMRTTIFELLDTIEGRLSLLSREVSSLR